MEIKGFIDLSMVDWDDKISSVIFLPGCTFRCPFCYNVALVMAADELPTIPLGRIESYLQRHKGVIEGAVVTGGEPTIHKDLPDLCKRLKKLGFNVKVDTNGANPFMVRELIDKCLVDYVAMDIKAPLTKEKYFKATGVDPDMFLNMVKETAKILMRSNIDYEFRTTAVPTIHSEQDIREISKAIKGCKKYVLQNFKTEVKMINPDFRDLRPFSREEMEKLLDAAKTYMKSAKIRC